MQTYPTPLIPELAEINPCLLTARWSAVWSRHSVAKPGFDGRPVAKPGFDGRPDKEVRNRSGVFLFRRTFEIAQSDALLSSFIVHICADARYRLFVNGTPVCFGPARGDLLHTRFDSLQIAPFLQAGKNTLAVCVTFQERETSPVFQQSVEAALLVQGNGDNERRKVDTPTEWRVFHDAAYEFSTQTADALHTYCVIGGLETMHTNLHPWGWEQPDFDDSAWEFAQGFGRAAAPYEAADGEAQWWLTPRTIPFMEETPQRFARIVRAGGIEITQANCAAFLAGNAPLTIAAHANVTLLLDQAVETCAFPELLVSGGKNATLELSYAEALMDDRLTPWDANRKTGRDNAGDHQILRGYADTWHLDGSNENRLLRPTYWRTFRYAQITVQTQDEPLVLSDVRSIYTGYPFKNRATFHAPEIADLPQINEIGWRTARLCAHETYTDCPYYEQLQYVGDTRIQALVTLYTSGDARLFRNALAQFDQSRIPDGLTQSRYPSRILQIIPGFSLWYIGMVYDYLMHVPGDDDFLRGLLPGIRSILEWFAARLRPDNLLGPLPWWNFVDWCPSWPMGVPPGANEGGSSIMSLQVALALQNAAQIFAHFGYKGEAAQFRAQAKQITRAVQSLCCDSSSRYVADTPEKQTYSQHAALLLVLTGAVPRSKAGFLMWHIMSDTALTKTTFYFRFYLARALVKGGKGDFYLHTLDPWRDMMAQGLTTWAENPEPTRSDCHAWSSSPNYEFLATVLGIGPDAPGWETVQIAPHLGPLTQAMGSVPHPKGEIRVTLKRTNLTSGITAKIYLPNGVSGHFVWRKKVFPLRPGLQEITV